MKTYYDRRLLMRATPELLFAKFGQKRGIPRNAGKTIEFRKFATLGVSTTALTEGVPPALQDLSVSAITATVIQQGNAVGFSDLVSTTTIDPILEETVDLLAENAAETLDQIQRDLLVAGTTVQYASTATSRVTVGAAMTFTVAELREAVLTLMINRARKIDGFYQAIIHPRTFHDLQGTSEWVTANNENQTGRVFDGSMGTLYGVKFWVTDKAPVFPDAGVGGTVDVFATLIFGKDAYALVDLAGHNLQTIYKPLGSAGTADPLNQQQSMGWKATATTKIIDQAWMIRVEHSTSTAAN
jgi:N4-gp56 family major capsid protein